MSDLEHFAGAIAPVVRRLRAAVERGVASTTADFLHEWELDAASARLLAQLRNTTSSRLAPWSSVAAVHVYEAPSTVMRAVDDLVERGLIDTTVDGARLATKGGEAIAVLQQLTEKVTDELWGEQVARCESLLPLLRGVVDTAAETGGEAFQLQYPPCEGVTSATAQVADLLEGLHSHRFDARVSAWRAAGLDAYEAQLLTGGTLWRVLQEDTDVRDAAAYSTLRSKQRLELLSGLGSLPG